MRKITYIVLTLLVLSACSKDDEVADIVANEVVENELMIKDVFIDDVLRKSYAYYDDNRLMSTKFYNSSGELYSDNTYEYDGDIVIHNQTFTFGTNVNMSSRRFYSVSDNVSRFDSYNSEGELTNYSIYSFDGGTCGHTTYESFTAGFEEYSSVQTFEYLDGNCSVEIYNASGDQAGELYATEMKDNKNWAYSAAQLDFYKVTNPHNTLSYTTYDNDGNPNNVLTYTYVYNDDNYPVTAVFTNADGVSSEHSFIYY